MKESLAPELLGMNVLGRYLTGASAVNGLSGRRFPGNDVQR